MPVDSRNALRGARIRGLLLAGVLMAAGVAACTKNSTSPSPAAATTTTTTAAATTVPATTTVPTTTTPVPTSFTLSGTVTGNDSKKAIAGAEIEILSGSTAGTKVLADANGFYTVSGLASGNVQFRVRAAGYDGYDGQAAIAGADLRLDVVMTRTTTTTTTTIGGALRADFTIQNPCTMAGNPFVIDCTADGRVTATNSEIILYRWDYLNKTFYGPTHALQLTCGDGPEQTVNFTVKLTVTEFGGATDTITKSTGVSKVNGACGFP